MILKILWVLILVNCKKWIYMICYQRIYRGLRIMKSAICIKMLSTMLQQLLSHNTSLLSVLMAMSSFGRKLSLWLSLLKILKLIMASLHLLPYQKIKIFCVQSVLIKLLKYLKFSLVILELLLSFPSLLQPVNLCLKKAQMLHLLL